MTTPSRYMAPARLNASYVVARTGLELRELKYGEQYALGSRVVHARISGVTPATERPLFVELRGGARYAATAPPSASGNVVNRGLEHVRLKPIEPTNFERATQAAALPFLARRRGEAHYAALTLPRERTPDWSACSPEHQRLGPTELFAFGLARYAERREPSCTATE